MRIIKKELVLMAMAMAFLGSYIGSAHAAKFFYYQNLEGLVLSDETYPFYADEYGNPYLEIDIDTPESVVYDITEDSVEMTIDLSDSVLDTANISLAFSSSDTNLIETPSNSETGDTRTLTIEKGSSTAWQDVTLTVTASHPDTADIYMDTAIVFSSNCSTPIDSSFAAVKKAADISTDYIIACDTNNNYLVETARDLLHITNYQSDANIGLDILAGDYKLLSNIDFDINWSINKTYQNEIGETSATKTATHPYIKSATVNGINNDVDWDLDGAVDPDTTEGWLPLGIDDGTTVNLFTGTFNGNNKTISSLYIGNSDYYRVGFIGRTFGATIHNIALEDFYVNVDKDIPGQIGSLIGYMNKGHTYSSYAKDGVVIFQGTASRYVGGLVGYQASNWHASYSPEFSLIDNSYTDNVDVLNISSGNTRFSAAAGLSGGSHGSNSDGGVQRSYAKGDVYCKSINNGCNQAAGLVGVCEMSYIKDSYYDGDIKIDYDSSSRYAAIGGISANNNGSAHNVYATGNANQINAQYYGAVQGNWSGLYNSYAISDDMTVSTSATASSTRCSYGYDSGCAPLTIQNSWLTSVWNLDGINMEPTLKNMPTF